MEQNSEARSEGGYPSSYAARRNHTGGLLLTAPASMDDISRLEGEYLPNTRAPITDVEELQARRTETSHATEMSPNDERSKPRSHSGDWDADSYLSTGGFRRNFNGYGNASVLPEDSPFAEGAAYGGGPPGGSIDGTSDYSADARLTGKTWRPLSRKIGVPSAILSPYR